MLEINRVYGQKNAVTDVLSFDYGEIVICCPVAERQAREHDLSMAEEISLLFVHGFLHILGFDHQRPRDRIRMRRAEESLLGQSGLIPRRGIGKHER